jgi:hypothetical protein
MQPVGTRVSVLSVRATVIRFNSHHGFHYTVETKLFIENIVERYVITTKCSPEGILDDIFDRLIGKFNFVTEGLLCILVYTRSCVSYLT